MGGEGGGGTIITINKILYKATLLIFIILFAAFSMFWLEYQVPNPYTGVIGFLNVWLWVCILLLALEFIGAFPGMWMVYGLVRLVVLPWGVYEFIKEVKRDHKEKGTPILGTSYTIIEIMKVGVLAGYTIFIFWFTTTDQLSNAALPIYFRIALLAPGLLIVLHWAIRSEFRTERAAPPPQPRENHEKANPTNDTTSHIHDGGIS